MANKVACYRGGDSGLKNLRSFSESVLKFFDQLEYALNDHKKLRLCTNKIYNRIE